VPAVDVGEISIRIWLPYPAEQRIVHAELAALGFNALTDKERLPDRREADAQRGFARGQTSGKASHQEQYAGEQRIGAP